LKKWDKTLFDYILVSGDFLAFQDFYRRFYGFPPAVHSVFFILAQESTGNGKSS